MSVIDSTPHHVALEFYRNRLSVIADVKNAFENIPKSIIKIHEDLKKIFDDKKISLQHSPIDPSEFLNSFNDIKKTYLDKIESLGKEQLSIVDIDDLKVQIESLFSGKVGAQKKDLAEMDKLFKDAESRISKEIPPGYKDNDKKGFFYHAGITYPNKYGDHIVWNQILEHAKSSGEKIIFFVTGDEKEDWWNIVKGKTIGPRIELKSEARLAGEIDFFHMYSTKNFLSHASKSLSAPISDDTLSEVTAVLKARQEHGPVVYSAHSRSMSIVSISPDLEQPQSVSNFSQIAIKFSNPVDRESVSYIGCFFPRQSIFVQWNTGGWVEYRDGDTVVIWHADQNMMDHAVSLVKSENIHYQFFEVQIGRPGTNWFVKDVNGNVLPHTNFGVFFHGTLETAFGRLL